MRSLIVVLSIAVMALFTEPINAQHHKGQGRMMQSDTTNGMMHGRMQHGKGMMQGKMMCGKGMHGGMMSSMMSGKGMMGHGMMSGMMHKTMRAVYHLPELENELNLTNKQVAALKKLKSGFRKNKSDWKAGIEKKYIDLENQIDNGADASQVKKTLGSISEIQVDMKVAGYETARKMLAILTPEQKEQWDDMDYRDGHHKKSGGMMRGCMDN